MGVECKNFICNSEEKVFFLKKKSQVITQNYFPEMTSRSIILTHQWVKVQSTDSKTICKFNLNLKKILLIIS